MSSLELLGQGSQQLVISPLRPVPINPIHVWPCCPCGSLVVAGSGVRLPGPVPRYLYGPGNGSGALLLNPASGSITDSVCQGHVPQQHKGFSDRRALTLMEARHGTIPWRAEVVHSILREAPH
jgi:hypothetical protein